MSNEQQALGAEAKWKEPSEATRERVREFNAQVDAGTLTNDPRGGDGPLSDIVCGWCGKIHLDNEAATPVEELAKGAAGDRPKVTPEMERAWTEFDPVIPRVPHSDLRDSVLMRQAFYSGWLSALTNRVQS